MIQRQSVMVGIPTDSNRVTIQVVGLLDALRVSSFEEDAAFDVHFCLQHGRTPVEYARNIIVGEFLRSNCDKLWFIDDDMLPDHSVARLLHSDADITCAQMYKFDHPDPEKGTTVGLGLCAMKKKANGLYHPIVTEPGCMAVQEVDAVGTGCTIISRRVLEDRRMWYDNVYTLPEGTVIDGNVDDGKRPFVPAVFKFLRAPSGYPLVGEDVDFCARAKALGYTVKVDLNAVSGHWKEIDINQAGELARETVNRIVRGIKTDDGKVYKYTVVKDDEAVA